MFLKKLTSFAVVATLFGAFTPALLASDEMTKFAPAISNAFPWLTNSVVTTWLVILALVLLIRKACGKPQLVPSKGQLAVETLLDTFKDMFELIVGKKALPLVFPLLVCLFIFILAQNWAGLIPGVGTIGFETTVSDGETAHSTFTPIFRAFGADMNGTLALALISFGAWFIVVIRMVGFGGLIKDTFGNKADKKELGVGIYYFLSLIFILVGCIDVISIIFRPVSLSFRLFGNVFGGEMLMHGTFYFVLFYFLEFIVGLVQALVFTLLSAVYIGLLTNHEEGAH